MSASATSPNATPLKLRPLRIDEEYPDVRLAPCLETFPNWDITIADAVLEGPVKPQLRLLLMCPPINEPFVEGFLQRLLRDPANRQERRWVVLQGRNDPHPTFGYAMHVAADLSDEELERTFRFMEEQMTAIVTEYGCLLLEKQVQYRLRRNFRTLCR